MAYSYNGTLSGNKKDWSTELCYNMDEPSKNFAKSKKPVTKDSHVLHDLLYGKCPE